MAFSNSQLADSLISAYQGTQENMTITVTSGTNFTATGSLWVTQEDCQTVGTVAQAIAQLPKLINHTVTINVGAGTYASTTISGFTGAGSIIIQGTWANESKTGAMSGTLTGGTTTTSAENSGTTWTASQLLDSFLMLSDGGSTYRRPIKANGATTITVNTLSAMSSGDTYAIQYPSSLLTALTITDNETTIGITGFECTTSVSALRNDYVGFTWCSFKGTYVTQYNFREAIDSCLFWNGSQPSISDCHTLIFTYPLLHVANMTLARINTIQGDVEALACTTTSALTLTNVDTALLGFNSVSSTFSPLTLTDVKNYTVSGIGCTGTTNTGSAGVVFGANTNFFYSTTPTLVATSNFSLPGGTTANWTASIANNSQYREGSVTLNRGTAPTSHNQSTGTISTLTADSQLLASAIIRLPFTTLAGAGSTQGDATAASSVFAIYLTGNNLTGVLLPTGQTSPSKIQLYINTSANTINVYPPSGATITQGATSLGLNAPIVLTTGKSVIVVPTSTTVFYATAAF